WLLLTPLDRRDVLRRPAAATAGIAVAAGGVLGVLALAMAGPFLRLPTGAGAHRVPWAWLVLAAVGGAGFFAAAMLAGVLAQPWPRWRVRLRAAGAVVGVAALAAADCLCAAAGTERCAGLGRLAAAGPPSRGADRAGGQRPGPRAGRGGLHRARARLGHGGGAAGRGDRSGHPGHRCHPARQQRPGAAAPSRCPPRGNPGRPRRAARPAQRPVAGPRAAAAS